MNEKTIRYHTTSECPNLEALRYALAWGYQRDPMAWLRLEFKVNDDSTATCCIGTGRVTEPLDEMFLREKAGVFYVNLARFDTVDRLWAELVLWLGETLLKAEIMSAAIDRLLSGD